jgi:hypothetical protein
VQLSHSAGLASATRLVPLNPVFVLRAEKPSWPPLSHQKSASPPPTR